MVGLLGKFLHGWAAVKQSHKNEEAEIPGK